MSILKNAQQNVIIHVSLLFAAAVFIVCIMIFRFGMLLKKEPVMTQMEINQARIIKASDAKILQLNETINKQKVLISKLEKAQSIESTKVERDSVIRKP
jgi:type IV secretory pathway component VirB8